jgi:hypothetical protein
MVSPLAEVQPPRVPEHKHFRLRHRKRQDAGLPGGMLFQIEAAALSYSLRSCQLARQPFIDSEFNEPLQISAPRQCHSLQASGSLARHREGHMCVCICEPALRLRQKMPYIPLSHINLITFRILATGFATAPDAVPNAANPI